MKRKLTKFTLIVLLGIAFIAPQQVLAHHGNSNWETHYSYSQCITNDTYLIEQQHRHVGGQQEVRTVTTKLYSGCSIINSN